LIPAWRNVFLLVSIVILPLSLYAAPGCCSRYAGTGEKAAQTDNPGGAGRAGVTVTKEVPHSNETIPEISDRETTGPLPSRGDTAIHSHKIPRPGNDNDTRTE